MATDNPAKKIRFDFLQLFVSSYFRRQCALWPNYHAKKAKSASARPRPRLAVYLTSQARRGQQYCGGPGSPDVVGLPGVHVEVKRAEKQRFYDWIEQAVADAIVIDQRRRQCADS
jgi:hypothetical protein